MSRNENTTTSTPPTMVRRRASPGRTPSHHRSSSAVHSRLALSSRSPLIRARANPANLGTTCQLQQLIQGNGLSVLRTDCSEEPGRRCPARVAELQPDALGPRFRHFVDAALKRKAGQDSHENSAEDGPADYLVSWVNVI